MTEPGKANWPLSTSQMQNGVRRPSSTTCDFDELKEEQGGESRSRYNSEVLTAFLEFIKNETDIDVTATDAVFHREYAKYRHMPYPDPPEEEWRSVYMPRSWINVLLHEGMTKELRQALYPHNLDLGNIESSNETPAKLSELLRELNGPPKELRGANSGGITKKELGTVLNGVERTIGRRVKDQVSTVGDLKVVKLLYRMTKERASHLFGLIAPPGCEGNQAALEFGDAYVDRQIEEPTPNEARVEENALLIADLISYLSVEIPEITLKVIHGQLLNYSRLLEAIVTENDELLHPLREACSQLQCDPANVYLYFAQIIESYQTVEPSTCKNTVHEALYTHLRSLHFQHFVGAYADIVEKAIISEEIKPIHHEMERFCAELSEANMALIDLSTPMTSLEDFPSLVKRQSTRFKSLIKSATGFSTRDDALDVICSHASKILNAYLWVQFQEKDLRQKRISVADCVASLIAIRHQQCVKTKYKPRWFGLKDVGDSPLRYFARERSVSDLQNSDYIPEGVNQLLYQRFCQIHLLLIGNHALHEAWMRFQLARLRQYALCMRSNNISSIITTTNAMNAFCSRISSLLTARLGINHG